MSPFTITKFGDTRLVKTEFKAGTSHTDDKHVYQFNVDCVVDRVEQFIRRSPYYHGIWSVIGYKWDTLRPKSEDKHPDPKPSIWARIFKRRNTIPKAQVVQK